MQQRGLFDEIGQVQASSVDVQTSKASAGKLLSTELSERELSEHKQPEIIHFEDLPNAHLAYFPRFLSVGEADEYLQYCIANLQWREDVIKMYGKTMKVPRLTALNGEPEAYYRYSGLDIHPKPWTETLLTLRDMCQQATQCQFNSVLANLYRTGQDSMGFHADDEAELGEQPVIAAISLGQVRTLKFRHQNRQDSLDLNLAHGSLLVMAGDTQRYWQHGISKTKKPLSERVSLTFRRIYR